MNTHPYYPGGNPRFNHIAMSVPAEVLDENGRGDLCRFFDEVLGFEELPTMTVDRKRLIFSCVHWDQFIFLIAEGEPDEMPTHGPLGLSVVQLGRPQGRAGTGPWPSEGAMTGWT